MASGLGNNWLIKCPRELENVHRQHNDVDNGRVFIQGRNISWGLVNVSPNPISHPKKANSFYTPLNLSPSSITRS